MKDILLDADGMTLKDLAAIARQGVKVQLTKDSEKRIAKARKLVEQWVQEEGVCPVVPKKGAVGASGDLVPLAHLSLVLIGQGEAFYNGQRISGIEALQSSGLSCKGWGH